MARRLCTTFGYKWRTIERPEDATNATDWTTHSFPMRPRALWSRWQDAGILIGVRFPNQTRYALIDIDAGGDYHDASSLEQIREALETIGIVRTILTRSSWSGGWHLYCPLPAPVSTFNLACTLKHCLEAQGIKVKPGHCETFPNIKPYGRKWEVTEYNGHRLPLQPGSGSCILDHNLNPTAGTLERFFWQWDFCMQAQDMELLIPALEQGRELQRKRRRSKAGKLEMWADDLRREIDLGWTGHGQTNGILKAIACYGRVFEGLADDELATYVEQMALTRDGYQEWCRHQGAIAKKSRAWAKWATRFWWPIGTQQASASTSIHDGVVNQNDEKQLDARRRISQAITHLCKKGELPEGVTARIQALCKLARTSVQTLYKNLALWHPDHWCVIPEPEGGGVRSRDCNETSTNPPEQPPSEGLHTLGELLRCVPVRDAQKNLYPRGEGGGSGGGEGFSTGWQGV
ncbi:hypothetical protein [Leptolyngbya sp. Heron Island J]|uniref:hypothetical protein n=1 Tax=Leptolyngbya sp. Heron Island J TaxID=1385935 RepID=UPI00126938AD|nr:hypothetical protein [Leptolyngbya sp. Heron Island J]